MTVLSQEIVERLVSQFLEGLHAFGSEQPELLPGLLVKLDAFANHGVDSRSGEGRRFECPMRVVRVGIIIFGGFSVFFQLALASFCKLLPGLSHLLQVLAMRRGGGSRHVPAVGYTEFMPFPGRESVQAKFVPVTEAARLRLANSRKEHIANREQIVYIACLQSIPTVRRGRVVGGSNPGHKERDIMSQPALRLVEGSSMDKSKALSAALSQIERQFGKGSVMKLGKNDKAMDIEAISSGSLGLDIALGIGGLPRGRVVEIYGPESSGKTTLALHTIAEAQKKGGICAFVDAEHALDPIYARKLGVNVDDLLISQPDAGEQALEIADTLVRSGAIDVLVVDSVAALVPRSELEGEMGDVQPGSQARLMSQALRKLTASISRSRTMVIFINQIRMKIGVMYGSPETTSGGNALKFYASVRLDIRRIGAIKERDEVIGNQTRVKVVKNKLAPPFKQVEFDIMYGEGVSKTGELVDLGVKANVVEKSGAWFSYDSQRIGQGRENAKQFLKENPDIAAKIEAAVRQNAGLIAEAIMAGDDKNKNDDDEEAAEA
jgi:recombination protein RecA